MVQSPPPARDPRLRRALVRARPALLGAGAYLVLLVVLVGPARLVDGERAIGRPTHDLYDHLWLHEWVARSLGRDSLRTTTELAWPDGGTILHPDPVGAALYLTTRPWLGPVRAFDAMLVLQLWLGALAGWALARRVSGSTRAGWLGGLLIGASPYLMGQLHGGETETVAVWPVVAALWLLERVTDRGRWHDGLGAGAVAGIAALGSWYHGAFVVLYGVAWLAVRARNRACLAVPAAFVAVVIGPALIYAVALEDPGNLFRGPTMHDYLDSHPEALAGMVTDPASLLGLFPARAAGAGHVHGHYLGTVAVALAAVGLISAWRRGRWWAGVALGALALALGPLLYVGGQPVIVEGEPVPLPYRLLADHVPLFGLMRIPHRWSLLTTIALAVLAARGAARLADDRAGRWVLLCVLALLHVADVALFARLDLRATTEVAAPAVLRSLPGSGAVLQLPPRMAGDDARGRYLVWQREHGRPIPYSLLMSGLSPSVAGEPLLAAVAALDSGDGLVGDRDQLLRHGPASLDTGGPIFSALWSGGGPEGGAAAASYVQTMARYRVEGVATEEIDGAAARLSAAGIDTVVLHRTLIASDDDARAIRTLLTRALGIPARADDDAIVWSLPGGAS